MTAKQIHLLKSTWSTIAMLNTMITENLFYSCLESKPEIISVFYSLIKKRSNEVVSTDAYIISRLHKLDDIINELGKLSNSNMQNNNEARHYITAGKSLLQTLKQGIDRQRRGKIKTAWLRYYTTLSDTLIQAVKDVPLAEIA